MKIKPYIRFNVAWTHGKPFIKKPYVRINVGYLVRLDVACPHRKPLIKKPYIRINADVITYIIRPDGMAE